MIQNVVYVMIGGGIGSALRYLATSKIDVLNGWQLPVATMTVNVVGSFLIAVFYGLSAKWSMTEQSRLLLTTGLCGGFTTFSTFSYENVRLLQSGQWHLFAMYALLSIVLCVAGAALGMWMFSNHSA